MSTVVSSGELLLRSIVFTRPVRLVEPPSWVPHIPFAFWLIDALRPRTVVELGTQTGVSYSAFAQAVQTLSLDTATYAVDTWKGDHQAGFYDEDVFKEWSSFHDQHFSGFSRLVRSTFDEALSKFPDGSVDLLHIDGLHTYEAVRQDFESWFPKLSHRAVVLMHDTNVREGEFGVWRFWAEVAARYPSFAFLHGHGLGVVGIGHSLAADVRWLVDQVNNGQIAFTVREFFATLGEGLLRQLRESAQAHDRAQMVGRLAEQDALVARLTAEATQVSARQAGNEAALRQLLESVQAHDRTQMVGRLAEQDALIARLTADATQVSTRQAKNETALQQLFESALAHERAQMVGRLAEQDSLIARLTADATQVSARHAENQAAIRQVNALGAELLRQLSAASIALDHAHIDARAQGEQLSTMTTELASLREDLRPRLEQTKAALDRTQVLERELAALREDTRAALRRADAERDRAEGLQTQILGLQSQLKHAYGRRARLKRKLLKLQVMASRLTRQHATQTVRHGKLEQALQQAYNSRSWRWTAAFRRTRGMPAGWGYLSFARRNLARWAHAARTLLSPSRLRNVREIARCGLFDEAFYLRTYPDVGRAAISPLVHYAVIGAREGRRPHPLFDGKYYLSRYADARESWANPLLHFVRHGATLARDPHPLFSTRYYLAANPEIRATGLDPLSHYMTLGSQKGLTPHPLFDPAFYLHHNADARAPGVNPLVHFIERGTRDGRSPHPLFDAKFYAKKYGDLPGVSTNPLLHYLEAGVRESHDPHPLFQNSFYLRRLPELQHLGITPLQHFVESGVHEGRRPNPLFDPVWYLETYPDVAMSGQNPLAYYATKGWREGHDPSPGFSTTYYLEANPEVEAAGVCPLEHYLRDGRREGRLPPKGRTPDDSPVLDAPPSVRLEVRRAHTTPAAATDTALAADTIICVSHVVPLPPRAGNEYRIDRMLVRLRRSGYRVVLVISPLSPQTMGDAQWEKLAAAYGNAVHCERDGSVRHHLDECPDVLAPLDGQLTRNYAALLDEARPMPATARELLQVDRSFCHDTLIATLVHLQSSLRPCAVIAEYIWMTRAFPLLDPGILTVIDTIDVFSTYHEKVGAFGVAGWDVPPDEEARRLARAKVIVAIQSEEAQTLCTLAPDREVLTVGVDFDVIEHGDWPADPIVFCVGSDNPRNMLGLRDFLKFAWPEIRIAIPDARLAVAGSVGSAVPDYAQGVDVLGHIDDLNPLYMRARVVVNPAAAGTGLKIKTVEALSRLRPIVTWPNGLEGLPPEMAELVPPAQDWFDFAERAISWLRSETPAFDAATAVLIRRLLSADHVYGALEARLASFFDAHRSRTR
jgi:hypothetical protein